MIRNLLHGFMKVHVLHHAEQAPIYGAEMLEELAGHGYRVSPGTLYPLLHALEHDGLLERHERVVQGRRRKYYRATTAGRAALAAARAKVRELADEVLATPGAAEPETEDPSDA